MPAAAAASSSSPNLEKSRTGPVVDNTAGHDSYIWSTLGGSRLSPEELTNNYGTAYATAFISVIAISCHLIITVGISEGVVSIPVVFFFARRAGSEFRI